MAAAGEAVLVDGLGTRVQRPRGWANRQVLDDARRHTHTARLLAGLRAPAGQAIAQLGSAWALGRRRGLDRVRDVFRAAGALVCLGRWLHRIPT
jgi:hypothetical protein